MPSIHHLAARHGIVDAREGHYLSFPDLWRLPDGTLLCAYREADTHVPTRRRLLMARSTDGGGSWSEPWAVNADTGHCPRFCMPGPGPLRMIDDAGRLLYESADQGRSWSRTPYLGMPPGLPDRILRAGDGTWLCCTHRHEGDATPEIGQSPTVQGVFASRDAGRTWERIAVLSDDPNLVLCEASMALLPNGRILAMMRENSQVFEPMYLCHSDDHGRTWSTPRPTCLIGHRPTLGLVRDGNLLVTYRNRGPAGGTVAWKGRPGELDGFAVHGPSHGGGTPEISGDGLVLHPPRGGKPALYALRPITHPKHARAMLEAEVLSLAEHENDGGGVLNLGIAWRVLADRMVPILPPADKKADDGRNGTTNGTDSLEELRALSIPLPRRRHNTIRLEYAGTRLDVSVNGQRMASLGLDAASVLRRGVVFGAASTKDGGPGSPSMWRRIRQFTLEPSAQTPYVWDWDPSRGQPDAHVRSRVLELASDHGAAWCDYGYSGWVEQDDGAFLCAYHHADAAHPDYVPGDTSWIQTTRFFATDFAG